MDFLERCNLIDSQIGLVNETGCDYLMDNSGALLNEDGRGSCISMRFVVKLGRMKGREERMEES